MNEHQGNEIEFRLITVLNRPYRCRYEGEQSMKRDTEEHGKGPQSVEVVVSMFFRFDGLSFLTHSKTIDQRII